VKIYYLLITVSITEDGFFINTRRVSGFAKSNALKKLLYFKKISGVNLSLITFMKIFWA